MKPFSILNLYSGLGGNRYKWDSLSNIQVTSVEINKDIANEYKKRFPNDNVICADAHQYLLDLKLNDELKNFHMVWASPPCPTHSRMMKFTRHDIAHYPDMKLYQEIIFLDNFYKGKYVVENVIPYYKPLIQAKEIDRHLFWTNFKIGHFEIPKYKGNFLKSYDSKLEEYYGINLPDKNIYFKGSHDQFKILKNCVHPEIGLYILKCALEIHQDNNKEQLKLF